MQNQKKFKKLRKQQCTFAKYENLGNSILIQQAVVIHQQKFALEQLILAGTSNSNFYIFNTSFNSTFEMSFEVRVFQAEDKKGQCIWKFQLGKNSVSQVDFYAEQQSIRSLFHLAQDMSHQIQTAIDKKKKKMPSKDRAIRKICEKTIKSLSLTLKAFAHDIKQNVEDVRKYFGKSQLNQEHFSRIQSKCQKWILEVWVRQFAQRFKALLFGIIIFRRL